MKTKKTYYKIPSYMLESVKRDLEEVIRINKETLPEGCEPCGFILNEDMIVRCRK